MDCAETKPLLPSYVRDDIGGPDREAIEAHLVDCDDCSLALDLLRHPPATPADTATDWTVERIFADGGGSDRAEEPPAPDAEARAREDAATDPNPIRIPGPEPEAEPSQAERPAPRSENPLILPPPEPEPASARPASTPSGSASGDWEFEPAGANMESGPPDQSLQFAEQALGRKRGRSRVRSGAVRALVWGIGGVAGLGLLGASIWVAISVHPAATGDGPAPRIPQPRAESPGPIPQDAPPPQGALPESPAVTAAPPASGTTPGTVDPSPPPPTSQVAAKAPAPVAGTGAVAPKPKKATASAPAAPRPESHSPTPRSGSERAAAHAAPVRVAAPAPVSESGGAGGPRESATSAASGAPVPDDIDMWPVDDVVTSAPAKTALPKTTVVMGGPTAAPPAPTEKSGDDATAAPPAPATSASPEPKAPPTEADRLHEATETAAAAADLDALRRLRDTWKDYLKTAMGPARSRAKREYADCLWAIQLLTGRQDDQHEALLAYRDFIINAPAGGADPRSASRLRQLEDVLVERR